MRLIKRQTGSFSSPEQSAKTETSLANTYCSSHHQRNGLFDDVDILPALGDVDGLHSLQHVQSTVLTLEQESQETVEDDTAWSHGRLLV